MGRDVVLVSPPTRPPSRSGPSSTRRGLGRRTGGGAKGEHRFVSSGDVAGSGPSGSRLLGPELDEVEQRACGRRDRSPCSAAPAATPVPAGRAAATWCSATTDGLDRRRPGHARQPAAALALTPSTRVVLSHEHPDHWSDLEGYTVAAATSTRGPAPSPVYAAAGVAERTYSTADDAVRTGTMVTDGAQVDVGDAATSRSRRTDHPARDAGRARRRRRPVARVLCRHRSGLVARSARARPRSRPVRGDLPPRPGGHGAALSGTAGGAIGAGGGRRPAHDHPPVADTSTAAPSRPRRPTAFGAPVEVAVDRSSGQVRGTRPRRPPARRPAPRVVRARLHRVRRRLGAGVDGPHQGAVHGIGRRGRPAAGCGARARAG